MTRPIVAGDLVDGVWCPDCNAPVRIRIPLHHGHTDGPPAAHLEVCVSCGHHYIPAIPVVEVIPQGSSWHRPRPVLAWLWWLHRRQSARDGRHPAACAYGECKRPGWVSCCWFESVEFGTVRWVFCGRRHRARWLTTKMTGTG